jgi:hypothetical protein
MFLSTQTGNIQKNVRPQTLSGDDSAFFATYIRTSET